MRHLALLLGSSEFVAYMVNLGVAVMPICGLGLLIVRAWRRGSAPLRHAILVWALVLSLLSPAAVWLAGRHGLALVRLTLPSADAPSRSRSAAVSAMAGPALRADAGRSDFDSASADSARRSSDVFSENVPLPASSQPSPSMVDERVGGADEGTPHIAWWQAIAALAAMVWAAGICLGLVRLAWGYVALARFCRRLDPSLEASERRLVDKAVAAVGLAKPPAVFLSPLASVPLSIGLLHPAVVLPQAMRGGMDAAQWHAVLLHEMAHIARRDHCVGVGQSMAAVMFWWNPPVHWLCDAISEVREEICDNHVVRVQGEGQRLAQILVDLAARARPHRSCPPLSAFWNPGWLDWPAVSLDS